MDMGRFYLTFTVLTIFAGLTAVSIWDIYNIIHDYVYENHLTLAKVVSNGLGLFPYISYLQIVYVGKPTLMERFTLSVDEYKNISTMALLRQNYEWPRNISKEEADVYKAFFDLKAYYEIGNRGVGGSLAPYYAISDEFELNRLADQYVSHPDALYLAKQARLKVRPLLLQYNTWADYGDTEFDMDMDNVITLTIPNNRTLDRIQSPFAYAFLDSVYVDRKNFEQAVSPPSTNPELWSNLDFLRSLPTNMTETTMKSENPPDTVMTTYYFSTSNIWVSSRKNFPPCDDEIGSNENRCEERIRLVTLSEVCECTPLTMALKESFRNSDRNLTYDRPFCNEMLYKKCKEDVEKEFVKRESHSDATEACSPCVSYKNSYEMSPWRSISTIINNGGDKAATDPDFGEPWRPRLKIVFEDMDGSYLYLEEKVQLSMAQLISQVGGDLGLYTGFSMMTVLELFLFIWRFCITSKKQEASSGKKKITGLRCAFTRMGQAIGGIGEEASTNRVQDGEITMQQLSHTSNPQEKILTTLEERVQKLEGNLDQVANQMKLQLQKVKERDQNLEIKLEQALKDMQNMRLKLEEKTEEKVQSSEPRSVQKIKYTKEIQQKLEDEVDEAMKEWREELRSWKPSRSNAGAFTSKARRRTRSYDNF